MAPVSLPRLSFPKEKLKIVLLEDINRSALSTFKKAGYSNVQRLNRASSGEELKLLLKDAHVLGIRSKTKLSAEVLQMAPKLLAAGCFCIGTNQVDLDMATQLGVPIFNSPYSNTRSVAELVLAEAILLIRRIPERNFHAHRGGWLKDAKGSNEVRGKTLGIVGYGHIGSQVSVLAESLGFNVLFYDVEPKLPLGNATAAKSLTQLLKESDVVTLHVPGGEATNNIMNARAFKAMKKGSVFLNLARGTVVDIPALRDALKSGHLRGAAVDVFPAEPKSRNEKFESELQGIPNVILSPHIGGSTQEAQQNIGLDVATKIIQFLDTGATTGSQSIPSLRLPRYDASHRILHIHHNKPGVLSAINSRLSDGNINILGQYLKTNSSIGYVVLDVHAKTSKSALKHLQEVPQTIRTRILY
jgi:D-3-phosphoglycerate dehydrogenase